MSDESDLSSIRSDSHMHDEEIEEGASESNRIDDDGIDDSLDEEDDDDEEDDGGADDEDEDVDDGDEEDEEDGEANDEDTADASVAVGDDEDEDEDEDEDDGLSDAPVEDEEDDDQLLSDDDGDVNFKINDEDDLDEPEDESVHTASKKRSLSLKIKVSTATTSSKRLLDEDDDMYTDDVGNNTLKRPATQPFKRKVGRPRKSDITAPSAVGRQKRGASSRINYDDELDDDEELMSDSENIIPTPSLDDELLLTDEETEYTPDISKMTERQRAKLEMDETGSQDDEFEQPQNHKLLSLSNNVKQRRVLTEEENQLRKAEIARKRKNLTERKLEEEKQETIDKLLKRKAGKVTAATLREDEEMNLKEKSIRPQLQHEALFTWVSKKDSLALRVPEPLMK